MQTRCQKFHSLKGSGEKGIRWETGATAITVMDEKRTQMPLGFLPEKAHPPGRTGASKARRPAVSVKDVEFLGKGEGQSQKPDGQVSPDWFDLCMCVFSLTEEDAFSDHSLLIRKANRRLRTVYDFS